MKLNFHQFVSVWLPSKVRGHKVNTVQVVNPIRSNSSVYNSKNILMIASELKSVQFANTDIDETRDGFLFAIRPSR